jgi:hypothetical protein
MRDTNHSRDYHTTCSVERLLLCLVRLWRAAVVAHVSNGGQTGMTQGQDIKKLVGVRTPQLNPKQTPLAETMIGYE